MDEHLKQIEAARRVAAAVTPNIRIRAANERGPQPHTIRLHPSYWRTNRPRCASCGEREPKHKAECGSKVAEPKR